MTRASDVRAFRMYQQIRAQPAALEGLLAPEPALEVAAAALAEARRVFVLGVGSSANAAEVAARWLREAGLDARAGTSFAFGLESPPLRPGDAGLVFSHRGLEQNSRKAAEAFLGAGLALVQVSGEGAPVPAGARALRTVALEPSPVHTLSYTAALLVAARLVDRLRPALLGELRGVPGQVRAALALESALAELAPALSERTAVVALGAGLHEWSARELAIKLCEAARVRCSGHEVEQFLHGLHVSLQHGDAVVCFAGDDAAAPRTGQAAAFAAALGLPVLWIGAGACPAGVRTLALPEHSPWLSPLLEAIPAQLLAAHLAAQRGVDADALGMDEPGFERAFELTRS